MTDQFIRITDDSGNNGKYIDNEPLVDPSDGLTKYRQKVVLSDGIDSSAKPNLERQNDTIIALLKTVCLELKVQNFILLEGLIGKRPFTDIEVEQLRNDMADEIFDGEIGV
jgi:hypothetical protein